MFRRLVVVAVAVAATGIMVLGYFSLKRNIQSGTDPFTAIAEDAVVIVKADRATDFLSFLNRETLFWPDLNKVLKSDFLVSQVEFLDSLLDGNQGAGEFASGKSLYFSLHPSGKDNYETVFYSALIDRGEIRSSRTLVSEILSEHAPVAERSFQRTVIYESSFTINGELRVCSWTVSHGVLMLSFSPVLIENAIMHLDSGSSITEDPAFQRVHSTSGRDVDANVYINLRHLPDYLSAFAGGDTKNFLEGYSGLGSWAELDLHLGKNGLLMNGFSVPGPEKDSYLSVFSGQSPVRIGIESVIPGYSSAFLAMGLTDAELFHDNFREWMEKSGRLSNFNNMAGRFLELTGHEPFEAFNGFMDREAAMVLTGWDESGEKGESFLVLKTRSRSMALESLLDMIGHHAGLSGDNIDTYREVYQVDRETSFDIYRFPFSNTGELLFGKVFGGIQTSWFGFVGNYLVFGESVAALSEFIHANVLNQTLSANSRFREFSEFLVSGNNLYFYCNLTRSPGLFTSLLRDDLAANLAVNIDHFRKFRVMSLQFSADRDLIYNNIFLRYSGEITEEPRTKWQTLLDTVADFKPLLLVNHNTGENEIFIQDVDNNIYLINSAGRILWKKPLPGRIMGNVYQVDYYNNNRLQMLFNTREQIFLLDRNGNDVGRYPIRLPSPATNGIALFDYDNDRNYRIFLACEDRSVEVRTIEGNIVPGWNFSGTEHQVNHDIRFFRVGGRDHIVFADRHRVYITDRRGNIRVRPDTAIPVSPRNGIAYEERTPSSDPRLAITDTTGRVWHIYFDGKTEPIVAGNYSSDHFFDFQDVTADGYKDYIFLDNNRLDVYSRDGLPVFSHEFSCRVSHAPAYYHFSGADRKLGVVCRESEQIYLFNSDGDIYNGFPLKGSSYFTIGFLESGQGNFHLLVGSGDNFLYNYTVY